MEPAIRSSPHNRGADIKKIAISVGPRAQDRIGEYDRIALAPSDLFAECRTMSDLIGRTSKTLRAAKREMSIHQPPRHIAEMRVAANPFWVEQVERTDIKGCGHLDFALIPNKSFRKMDTGIAVIKTTINMHRRDLNQMRRAQ